MMKKTPDASQLPTTQEYFFFADVECQKNANAGMPECQECQND